MITRLKNKLKTITGLNAYFRWQRLENEQSRILTGRLFAETNKLLRKSSNIEDYEFSVFSQLGDDGIIQHLVNTLPNIPKRFVEFGVQNYIESNTRFLLMNNNWSGLVMDGSKEFIDFIKSDYYFWKHNLSARHQFVTAENINTILKEEGFNTEVGILHIDIDGNDYWIWEALEITSPEIVIMEYNSCFGPKRSITTPYIHDFERYAFHHSGLVFGASLAALIKLANQKGYYFAGSNSYGNNAYFLKNKYKNSFQEVDLESGYRFSYCRQNKKINGSFSFNLDAEEIKKINGVKVYNTITKQLENLNE